MKKITVFPPPVESLLHCDNPSLWPEHIRLNPTLRKQAELRRALLRRLEMLFASIPDPTCDSMDALAQGLVHADKLIVIYDLLSEFLREDPANRRLILYLPFEVLPDMLHLPAEPALAAAMTRFALAYTASWTGILLGPSELRANYVDGNIVEPELRDGPMPRVKKAAHLVPWLIRKGLLTAQAVEDIAHNSDDLVLRDSIFGDAKMALLPVSAVEEVKPARAPSDLQNLTFRINADVAEASAAWAPERCTHLPEARRAWEAAHARRMVVQRHGEDIAQAIANDILKPWELTAFTTCTIWGVHAEVAIFGIGRGVEQAFRANPERGRQLRDVLSPILEHLRFSSASGVRDGLITTWSRWAHLGLVNPAYLEQFGIFVPDLARPLTGRHLRGLQPKVETLVPAMNALGNDPVLANAVYPVAVLFGSRIKGYALPNSADLDVAVFIRPHARKRDGANIRAALSRAFSDRHAVGKVVEFWLDAHDDSLYVWDFGNEDLLLADPTWAHIPLTGLWVGDAHAARELHRKLLAGYIASHRKTVRGHNARAVWLDELERETLQYRLMHTGYARFYPDARPVAKERTHDSGLDPESAFYDSGFRRVATQLFLKRVFLPHLQ